MQQLLNTALVIAAKAHDGQFDKAGKPYLLHVLRVMNNLQTDDEELNCIAVLHDTVEDTAKKPIAERVTYQSLRDAGMTERIVTAVKLLTKTTGQTYEEYVEGVLSNVDAMRGKKADLTDNMDLKRLKGVAEKDLKRMNDYTIFFHKIDTKLKQLANNDITLSGVRIASADEQLEGPGGYRPHHYSTAEEGWNG